MSGGPMTWREVGDVNGWTEEANGCYWKRWSECIDLDYLEVVEKHLGPRGRWQNAAAITEKGLQFLKERGLRV